MTTSHDMYADSVGVAAILFGISMLFIGVDAGGEITQFIQSFPDELFFFIIGSISIPSGVGILIWNSKSKKQTPSA